MRPSRGFDLKPADIKTVRKKLKLSQSEFALMIGVSVSTLQNWEQGRRAWRPFGLAQHLFFDFVIQKATGISKYFWLVLRSCAIAQTRKQSISFKDLKEEN
jgi:transcriptional regulator with XRE-family HTH domain